MLTDIELWLIGNSVWNLLLKSKIRVTRPPVPYFVISSKSKVSRKISHQKPWLDNIPCVQFRFTHLNYICDFNIYLSVDIQIKYERLSKILTRSNIFWSFRNNISLPLSSSLLGSNYLCEKFSNFVATKIIKNLQNKEILVE